MLGSAPLISPEYADLNRRLHECDAGYGAAAGAMAPLVVQLIRDNGLEGFAHLDWGCGKGTLKAAVKRLSPRVKILEFDPAVPGKHVLPRPPRLGVIFALDVMEHVERGYLGAVLGTMRGLNPRLVYLMTSLRPARRVLPDGRNAHLIVESADWWFEQLRPYFRAVHEQRTESHYRFVGVPV